MKIIQIGKYFYPVSGGIETHITDLAKMLIKHGFDIEIFCSNQKPYPQIKRFFNSKIYQFSRFFDIFRSPISIEYPLFASLANADIFHLHLPNPWFSLFTCFKKNLVVTYHSDILPTNEIYTKFYNSYKRFLLMLLHASKKILVTSQNYANGSDLLRKFSDKVEIVPYGINYDDYQLKNKKIISKLKDDFNLHDKIVFLFVGRLVPYKGLEYLLYSIKNLTKTYDNIILIVIGSGPLYENLIKLSTKLGIQNNVMFIGDMERDSLIPYYQLADIFVLPSIIKTEAFGIVQLEAMASGLPVISTKIPDSGVSFVNQNNVTGLVVEPENINQLTNALDSLINDHNLRKIFGRNGKQRVKENFTLDIMTDKIIKIYNDVLKNSN